jgi:polysaccharide deacetylase family protein (PEP-CTERM system associated)
MVGQTIAALNLMNNVLTIDLEDYYHVSAFADQVDVEHWDTFKSRIENNTARLLRLLESGGQKATFFVLGWVAQKYPGLVREIARCGHEIASHSYKHRLVYTMTQQEFYEDTLQAKKLLEDASGTPVRGYRAPSFSITRNSLWAFQILAELGFTYDSSVFPIRHPNYGMPQAPRFPFTIQTASGPILEFPLPTLQMGSMRVPFAGGAYFRLLPYWYTRWAIQFLNTNENRPACIYLHPWELDSEQPRMSGSLSAQFRHYLGLRSLAAKFRRLLNDFDFQSLETVIKEIENGERPPEVPLQEAESFLGVREGSLGSLSDTN